MSFNYQFVINFAKTYKKSSDNFKILDFGCGPGEVVKIGLDEGLDIYGVDIFQGLSYKEEIIKIGYLNSRVFEINNGKIDFPDGYFDFIISNQVFEHVENFENVSKEIFRVLKSGGNLLSAFPTQETWIELHCKIPFVHKIKNRKIQKKYLAFVYRYIAKHSNDERSHQKRADDFIKWMNRNCFYRSIKEIKQALSPSFETKHIEDEYVKQRLIAMNKTFLGNLAGSFPINRVSKFLFQRFGGFVIVSEKRIK